MEKRIIFILLCLVCFGIQGCVSVSTYKIVPEILDGQKKLDRDGIDAVISHTKTASVFIRPMSESYAAEDNPAIVIGVSGDKVLSLSPENVLAYVDGKPHDILDHDQLLADIKYRHDAAVDSLKTQYNTRSKQLADTSLKDTSDPAVFEPNESQRNTIGSTEKYGYKLDKKGMSQGLADAEKQMQSGIEALERKTTEEIKLLNSTFLLRDTTVEPGTWYRGQIKLAKIPDAGKPHTIKLVITLAGEAHQFSVKTSAEN